MKRMSDVFELPLAVGNGRFSSYTVYGDDGKGDCVATFEKNEHAELSAHALNHIESLADALGVLLNDACDNGMHNRKSVYIAAKALAAYRGDK